MNDEHTITRIGVRLSFFVLIILIIVGFVYVSYRGDQRDKKNEEIVKVNCISLRDTSTVMLKLHEDIVVGFSNRDQPIPPAILADIAELHRLIPNCEGL